LPYNKRPKTRGIKMDSVIKYITGFFGGLMNVLMAVLPVTILWYVLTGGTVFGMDVVANLTALITSLGDGGFVGLVVLVIIASFFVKK
tara:strand:- start:375 stop:638 length:264 start_codon:yes stop_codon:yes gene_type:complete